MIEKYVIPLFHGIPKEIAGLVVSNAIPIRRLQRALKQIVKGKGCWI
jgi:hypothetical protein